MHHGRPEALNCTLPLNRSALSYSSVAQHGLDCPRPGCKSPCFDGASSRDGGGLTTGRSASTEKQRQQQPVDVAQLDAQLRRLSVRSGSSFRPSTKKAPLLSSANSTAQATSPAVTVAGQRVAEYEQALTPQTVKRGRVTVAVEAGTPSTGTQLVDLPNEILTQVFSHLHIGSHSAVALVSKRFYSLITTPHAWRMAFQRYFAGQDIVGSSGSSSEAWPASLQPQFARLTPLASWRSEYLMRTRLLRSIASGRPEPVSPAPGGDASPASASPRASAVITYNSQLLWPVDRLHAVFVSTSRKSPRVVHGSSDLGNATASNPTIGRLEPWATRDGYVAPQLGEQLPPRVPFGLGHGPAAMPNVMDVSHLYGVIVGEGLPGGRSLYRAMGDAVYAYLEAGPRNHVVEQQQEREKDIPAVPEDVDGVCAVWIAKTAAVPTATQHVVGMLEGSSLGLVTAYSLGKADSGARYPYSQVTARWVLSPGVPIVAVWADDSLSEKRKALRRVWAVALNALGEVFYLQDVPASIPRVTAGPGQRLATEHERLAWRAGRTARWQLVEATRRCMRTDDYFRLDTKNKEHMLAAASLPAVALSSSLAAPQQSLEERVAEARELEGYFQLRPEHFRAVYDSWDMRRKLVVDVGAGAVAGMGGLSEATGESIIVITPGSDGRGSDVGVADGGDGNGDENGDSQNSAGNDGLPPSPPRVVRYTRCSMAEVASRTAPLVPSSDLILVPLTPAASADDWQATVFSLQGGKESKHGMEITCNAIDLSTSALLAPFEDPLLLQKQQQLQDGLIATAASAVEVPGRRGRWLAVGTKSGAVHVWNAREQVAAKDSQDSGLRPLRVIQTDSPAVSSVAVSSLYLVHGGSDGLVQAWDPLASLLAPIRTLNARSASRVPRHLNQAQAQAQAQSQAQGLLSRTRCSAVGAIFLDPDATVLRGVLAVGIHLRFWSYSSSALHAGGGSNGSRKRQRRVRHTNVEGQLASRRLGVKVHGYIVSEAAEILREQEDDSRRQARLRNRFGVGLGGLTEEEALRYAEILSQEAFQEQQQQGLGLGSGCQHESSGQGSGGSSGEYYNSSSGSSAFGFVGGDDHDSVTVYTGEASAAAIMAAASPAPASERLDGPGNVGAVGDAEDDFELQIQRAIRLSLMEGVNSGDDTRAVSGATSGYAYHDDLPDGHHDHNIWQHNEETEWKAMAGGSGGGSGHTRPSAEASSSSASAFALAAYQNEGGGGGNGGVNNDDNDDDFQLALRLSLQEEEQRQQSQQWQIEQAASDAALAAALYQEEEFPALEVKGKGKGKGKGV